MCWDRKGVVCARAAMDEGGQVTLIFYQIDPAKWHKEPILNLVAAAAQWSLFTHVELAIGTDATASGAMTNVVRCATRCLRPDRASPH